MNVPCTCDTPGFCPVFNRKMVGRPYQICQGTAGGISEDTRLHYIRKWLQQSSTYSLPENVQARLDAAYKAEVPCIYRGKLLGHADCKCIEPEAIFECGNSTAPLPKCSINRKGMNDPAALGLNICRECLVRQETALDNQPPLPAYVNLDRIGWGDTATFAWIALGTKDTDKPLVMCATGEKARHIRMMGLEPELDVSKEQKPWSAFKAECDEGMVTPRLEFYADFYGVQRLFQKPVFQLPEGDKEWAATLGITKKTILFFPDSLAGNRRWPTPYWNMLGELLEAEGLEYRTFPVRNLGEYKNCVDARPMSRVLACMTLGGMGIGPDSAPINWTAIMDLPSIALLGPTKASIFSHAKLIRSLSLDPSILDCVGCCYEFKHQPHCNSTCLALANISPRKVAAEVLKYYKELYGTSL